MRTTPRVILVGLFCLLCLLLLTAGVYFPALDSLFLLDDYPNLYTLDEVATEGYQKYIFSGIAGPSGRPLSLFSFALQHAHWPNNPFPFKLFNLLLHLLNGVLIFGICRLLTIKLALKNEAAMMLSLLATALWLLHPLQLSTVLYVVQRMTQLSTLFMLLGLLGYLWARIRCREHRTMLVMMSLAVTLGTLLAILSKENGILLPLYILVVEYTVLADLPKPRSWKIWATVFLLLPLISLLIYLAYTLPTTLESFHTVRDFTAEQRLMTQAIVLFDYLHAIILPHPDLFSLFHDDYPFSTSLLSPPLTLVAIMGWGILLSFALVARKGRYRVIAFAILWFISGHLLEASHLNLELYFEHRNYLPALGIFFLLAWLSIITWQGLSNKLLSSSLIACFYALLIGITLQQLALWGNPIRQAFEWHRLHPTSLRAIDHMAANYLLLGEHEQAIKTHYLANEVYPRNIYPYIRELNIRTCELEEAMPANFWPEVLQQASHATKHGTAPVVELDALVVQVTKENCQIDKSKLIQLILVLVLNENFIVYKAPLHELAASLATHMQAPVAALNNISEAIMHEPTPPRHIFKIRLLLDLRLVKESDMAIKIFRQFLFQHPRLWLANRDIIGKFEAQWLELPNNKNGG